MGKGCRITIQTGPRNTQALFTMMHLESWADCTPPTLSTQNFGAVQTQDCSKRHLLFWILLVCLKRQQKSLALFKKITTPLFYKTFYLEGCLATKRCKHAPVCTTFATFHTNLTLCLFQDVRSIVGFFGLWLRLSLGHFCTSSSLLGTRLFYTDMLCIKKQK